ncbi:MAG TPA: hypothetical protein DIV86_03140 [Alphaproteobacteria bacterium]|nr:hypothetical protein [Alphaproteobacteria bacterium]
MKIISENDRYRITYESGDNNTLVIAFTGIELRLGEIQKEEFQKTLHSTSKNNHICYVIDKQRSWYNFIEPEIIEKLNQLIEKISAKKVVTLGNSMGGYGAIIFAVKLKNCSTAIAFCPQYSVNPSITPFETRWAQYRDNLTEFLTNDVSTEISDKITYNIFFGNLEKRDKKHCRLFEELTRDNLKIHIIKGSSHNVAGHLKEQGKLVEVIMGLI